MRTIVILSFCFIASTALAQPATTTTEPAAPWELALTETGSYRHHHMFFDWVGVSTAMGLIGGIVEGELRNEGFQAGTMVSHMVAGAFFGLFAGSSWGGEDGGPDSHPPTPVSTLKQLRIRIKRGDSLEVWTEEATPVFGKLVRIKRGLMVVETAQGRQTFSDSSLRVIATRRDPSWDGALSGAVQGALYAVLWAETGDKDPGASVSTWEMGLVGAAIGGGTGLAFDRFHNGRSVVFCNRVPRSSYSIRAIPHVSPGGGALEVCIRF